MVSPDVMLDPAKGRREHRQELTAPHFVESPYMEGVLKLVQQFPDMELSPHTRMALHLYREEKARAEGSARIASGEENEGGE